MNEFDLEISWNQHLKRWAKLCPAMHKPSLKSNEQSEIEFAELIIKARKFLKGKNLARYANLLVLDHFVCYVFSNMDPDYRAAKWFEMLEYMKAKYGSVRLPRRTADDPRESSFYNSISLLRTGYRGKTQKIKFDQSILELPMAKEWICIQRRERKKSKKVVVRPGIKEKKCDTDFWLAMLLHQIRKYGRYQKPIESSDDKIEKKYASKIRYWSQALKGDSKGPKPDRRVLDLPMAREWLSAN